MPLMSALGMERQSDLCELEASLVYRVSFQDSQGKDLVQKEERREGRREGLILRIVKHSCNNIHNSQRMETIQMCSK